MAEQAGTPTALFVSPVQARAVKALLAHRLPSDHSGGGAAAKAEWYALVEGEHPLWKGVSQVGRGGMGVRGAGNKERRLVSLILPILAARWGHSCPCLRAVQPYAHVIRAFLVHFHQQILGQPSGPRFNFSNGSIGEHKVLNLMCCCHSRGYELRGYLAHTVPCPCLLAHTCLQVTFFLLAHAPSSALWKQPSFYFPV